MTATVRTWHVELAIVAAILSVTASVTGGGSVPWIGAAAVTLGFAHVQVGQRMTENEAMRSLPSVKCHAMLTRYLVAKEVLWCLYFVTLGAWTALVGVGIFLAYPAWRQWWRARYPIESRSGEA